MVHLTQTTPSTPALVPRGITCASFEYASPLPRSGKVTPSMLSIEKLPLVLIGACEAVAQLLFMISAGHLPGVMLPVINQV